MDKPPPDDFDPYSLEERDDGADAGDCKRNDCKEDEDHNGESNAAKGGPKCPRSRRAPERSKLTHENSMQRIISFCVSLLAPPKDASPEEIRRAVISLTLATACIYVALGIAYGLGESIGLSGFAKAKTVAEMQRENTDFRISFYSLGIREFHHSYCNANTYQDQLLLNNQLERLKAGYQKEVGVAYVLPPCPVKARDP